MGETLNAHSFVMRLLWRSVCEQDDGPAVELNLRETVSGCETDITDRVRFQS